MRGHIEQTTKLVALLGLTTVSVACGAGDSVPGDETGFSTEDIRHADEYDQHANAALDAYLRAFWNAGAC